VGGPPLPPPPESSSPNQPAVFPAVSSVLDQLSNVTTGLCELGTYAVLWAMNSPPSGEGLGPEEQEAERLRHGQKWSKALVALLLAILVVQVLAFVIGQIVMAAFWWDALKVMSKMLRSAVSKPKGSGMPAPPGAGWDGPVNEAEVWRHIKTAKYANRWLGAALGRSLPGWHRHGPLTEEERRRLRAWYHEGAARREQYGALADGALLARLRRRASQSRASEEGLEDGVSFRSCGSGESRDGGARGIEGGPGMGGAPQGGSGTKGAAGRPGLLRGPDSDIESGCSTPRPPASRKGSRYNGESTWAVARPASRQRAATSGGGQSSTCRGSTEEAGAGSE